MNVTPDSFHGELPAILRNIANAQFVAFDLELSGIPAGVQRKKRGPEKQTLQDRYAEMKLSAETFNILQFGLTTVEEDPENGRYLTRAYNFNLSPMMNTSLVEMDRTITYSSSAVEFLLRNGYRIDAPFVQGLPYLMHDEASQMKDLLEEKLVSLESIPDIPLDGNEDAQRITKRVKDEIDKWLFTSKPNKNFLIIQPLGSAEALNSFERRLIYQLVRSGYPELAAAQSFPGCMRISTKANVEGENRIDSLRKRNASVFSEQFGFSWIAKALQGADLSAFDTSVLPRNPGKSGASYSIDSYLEQWDTIKTSLAGHKTVLVGHNCLIDLIFFYRAFCGELPAKVEDFAAAVSEIFPLIIDTKYLATAIPNESRFRGSELWRISENLAADQNLSIAIETAADQPSYENSGAYHEAGYDSYVTAMAFLRLASKLGVAGEHIEASEAKWPPRVSRETFSDTPAPKPSKAKKSKSQSKTKEELTLGKFFHMNTFDALGYDAASDSDALKTASLETPASSSNAVRPNIDVNEETTVDVVLSSSEKIPPWTNNFWNLYGNKLRVYGTHEQVCELKPARTTAVIGNEIGSPGALDSANSTTSQQKASHTDEQQNTTGGNSVLEMTGIKKVLPSISG